ncbi:MAG: hypothetical protein ACM3ML_01960 [Micromonosporaceae bacterium]
MSRQAHPQAGGGIAVAFSDNLVSELSIAAKAIGVDDEVLAAALNEGETIAQVAARNGVDAHRVVVALVSDSVAEVAADVRRGELTGTHVRWLVALATRRAEDQITSKFPPLGFRQPTPSPA